MNIDPSVFRSTTVSIRYKRWRDFFFFFFFFQPGLSWRFIWFPLRQGDSSRVPLPPLMETRVVVLSDRNTSLPCCFAFCWAYEQRVRMDQWLLKGLMGSDRCEGMSPPLASLCFLFIFFLPFFFAEVNCVIDFGAHLWDSGPLGVWKVHSDLFTVRQNAAVNCGCKKVAAWVTRSWLHVAFRSNLSACFQTKYGGDARKQLYIPKMIIKSAKQKLF